MAISEKKHFAHNESIANELLFSHYNPNFDYDKLRATNDAFVMKSNLQFGFTHAEYKFEDGEFYLIEIAARGGGNMISSCITQYMTGYDTYRYLVECATGNVHDEDFSLRPEYKERAAVLKFFETPNGGGKVREIKGLDYIENEPDIKHYRLNFQIGDTIENALNDSVRIGFYIVCSENMQKLREVISNVESRFNIFY
jgi:biotin carboxylase